MKKLFVRKLEAAPMLGVCTRTLSRWDKAGILKFTRIGERVVGYPLDVLEAFARGKKEKGQKS